MRTDDLLDGRSESSLEREQVLFGDGLRSRFEVVAREPRAVCELEQRQELVATLGEDLGRRLNTMSKAGQWDEMTALIDDDVVDLFCAKGTHDTIAAAIDERFRGLVDTVSLDAGTPASVVAEVRSIQT